VSESEHPEATRPPPAGEGGGWPAPRPAESSPASDGEKRIEAPGEQVSPIEVPWPSSVLDPPAICTWERPPGAPPRASGDGSVPEPASGGEPPPPPRRKRRHSRNPVDRLTRGLPDWLRITIDWLVTIAGAVAVVLLVKAYVVNPYRIPSASMEPTLHCARPESGCEARFSDRVLANRFIYRLRDPRRGEIVVFDVPRSAEVRCGQGGTFVKRIVGLPGETIEVRLQSGRGFVYIDGKKLNEPYVRPDRRDARTFGPRNLKSGEYFMMGDNRMQSCDSRDWGPVPRKNLIGKVFAIYWPPNRISVR
jgi:signal peptidase I